ncbi:GTPase-associated system all-helical protein GASH [Bradyrhizobium sp. SSUT77]|uniref:GTPase-associated system all-helical protein GASH n=1 Tax=Bradyrhizobium sp. SSUT77 TaxID=3040603 RepID=UPI002448B29A|nr:GTPase-associated system all-helical protein GASH [Bradyrhizobium sp. SSUT77]MDH2348149.1 GTPase-associated system all-helical protein GASH [Bradyrhizobium sp. SSUT77]
MTHIATHIRIFASDPSDELVEKRTAAIGEIAGIFKGRREVGELLQTANDLAVAVQQDGKLSAALTGTIEGAIRKTSTAFVAEGHELEMLVCGLSGALQAMSGSAALRHGAVSIPDVLSFGLWSALSYQKPRTEPKIEQLRDELLQAAHGHCAAVARDSRQRIKVSDPEFKEAPKKKEGEPETPFDASAMKEGLKPFKDAIADLRSNAAVDREEIDLLWWVLSDWSSLLGRRFSDENAGDAAAAVASGIEAGRMIRRAPAEAHRHLVLRYVPTGKDLSLIELLTAIGGDRAALAPTEAETYISNCLAVFPLSNALRTGSASDPRPKIKRPLGDWAARALLESSIAHLCSNNTGVSV